MPRWWENSNTLTSVIKAARAGGKKQPPGAPRPKQRPAPAPTPYPAPPPIPYPLRSRFAPMQPGQPSRVPLPTGQAPPEQWQNIRPPDQWRTMLPTVTRGYERTAKSWIPTVETPPWVKDYRRRFGEAWGGIGAPREDWEAPGAYLQAGAQLRGALSPEAWEAYRSFPSPTAARWAGERDPVSQASFAGVLSTAPAVWHDIEQIPRVGKLARVAGASLMTGAAILAVGDESLKHAVGQLTLERQERLAQEMRADPDLAARREGTYFDGGRVWYNLENLGYTRDEIYSALHEATRLTYTSLEKKGPETMQRAAMRIIGGEDPYIVSIGKTIDINNPTSEDLDAYYRYLTSVYKGALQEGLDEAAASTLAAAARQEIKVNGRIPGEQNIFLEMIGAIFLDPLNIVQRAMKIGGTAQAIAETQRGMGYVEEIATTPAVAARAAATVDEAVAATELGKIGPLTAVQADEAAAAARMAESARLWERMDEAAATGRRVESLQTVTPTQAQRGARLLFEKLVPPQFRAGAAKLLGGINPFELTEASKAHVAITDAGVVFGTVISRGKSTPEIVNLLRRFVENPDSLKHIFGNLADWGQSTRARELLRPLVDSLEELPSVKVALESGELVHPAHLMADLNDAFLKLMKVPELAGPKWLMQYRRFANGYRHLMSEFYLRTIGYLWRQVFGDTVTIFNDGLGNLDSWETSVGHMREIGWTTARIESAMQGTGLGYGAQGVLVGKSVMADVVGAVAGEGAGAAVRKFSMGFGELIAHGKIPFVGKTIPMLGEESRILKTFDAALMNALAETWKPVLPSDLADLLGGTRTSALEGALRRKLSIEGMMDAASRATATGDAPVLIDFRRYLQGEDADRLSQELLVRLDIEFRGVTSADDAAAVCDKLIRDLDLDLGKIIAGDPPVPARRINIERADAQAAAADAAGLERVARQAGVDGDEAAKIAEEHQVAMTEMQKETAALEEALLKGAGEAIDAGQDSRRVAIALRQLRVEIANIQSETTGVIDEMRQEVHRQLNALRQLETTGPIGGSQREAIWNKYYNSVPTLRGDEQTKIRRIFQNLQQAMAQGQLPDVADDVVARSADDYRIRIQEWLDSAEAHRGGITAEDLFKDDHLFEEVLKGHRLASDGAAEVAWKVAIDNPSRDSLDIMAQAERDAQNIGSATAARQQAIYNEWHATWDTAQEWTKAEFRKKVDLVWRAGFSEQANRFDLARRELLSLPVGDAAQRTLLQELGWSAAAVDKLSDNAVRLVLKERMVWDAALGGPAIPVAQLKAWTLESVAESLGIKIVDPRKVDPYDWGRIADLAERDMKLYRLLSGEDELFGYVGALGDGGIENMASGLQTLTDVGKYADDAPGFLARMREGADRCEELMRRARIRQQVGTRTLDLGITVIPDGTERVARVRVGDDLYKVEVYGAGETPLAEAMFESPAAALREVQRIKDAIAHGVALPRLRIPMSMDDAIEMFGIDRADPDDLARLAGIARQRGNELLADTQVHIDQRTITLFEEQVTVVRDTRVLGPGAEENFGKGMLPVGYRLGQEPFTKPGHVAWDKTEEWYQAIPRQGDSAAQIRELGNDYMEQLLGAAGVSEEELEALKYLQRQRLMKELGQGTLLRTPAGRIAKIGPLTSARRRQLLKLISPEVQRLAGDGALEPGHALAYGWLGIADQATARQETTMLLKAGVIDPTYVPELLKDAPAREALIKAMEEMDEWDIVKQVGDDGFVTFTQVKKAPAVAPVATVAPVMPEMGVAPVVGRPDLVGAPPARAVQPATDSILDIFAGEGLDKDINLAVHKLVEGGMPVEDAANLGLEALDDPKAKEALLDLAELRGGMSVEELKIASENAGLAVPAPTYGEMADIELERQMRLVRKIRDGVVKDWDSLQAASKEGVPPWVRGRVMKWARTELPPQWAKTRTIAVESARRLANFALLDYNLRRRFDTWLAMMTPYSYWKTRSARNWAIRLAQQPGTLSNYMHYQRGMKQYAEEQGYRSRFEGTVPVPTGDLLPDWMGGELFVPLAKFFFPFTELAPNDWEDPADAKNGIDYLYRTMNKWGFRPFGFLDAAAKVTGVAGASGMPGEGTWWQPLVSTPQGTAVQAIRSLLQDEEDGPIRNLFGQLNLDEFDCYRIDRMLSNMSGDDPTITLDALLAKAIVERVAMDEIEPKDSLVLGPNMMRLAEVNDWPVEELERAQRLLGIAWLRMQQEKALPGAVSSVLPMSARPYPTGERRQLEMQRESAAAGYDPLTGTGSREKYMEYMKQHPEAYTRTVAGQVIPGSEITEETWTPAERRGSLMYQPEKAAALEQLGQDQLQALASGGLWNDDSVREARKAHTDAMTKRREELVVGEYAWPDGIEETWTSMYGSNPEEAKREAERELLGWISDALPRYAQFENTEDYEKAQREFYAALAAGDFLAVGIELPENLPPTALAYGQQITEEDLTAFWRENDTLAEALVETFGSWYTEQWDLYNEARGPDSTPEQLEAMTDEARDAYYARREAAWQQYVETNRVPETELALRVGKLYGDRWTRGEIETALASVEMPTTKEAWLGRKTPEEREEYEAGAALSDAKGVFWEAYWALPDDADWRSTKGQPLIAFIVDRDTRDLATAEQYQAAAAVLRRYLEDFGGEPGAGGAGAGVGVGAGRAAPRRYYEGVSGAAAPRRYGGGGGGRAAPRPAETWDEMRKYASGPLMRQLADYFLRSRSLDTGAMAELEAMMTEMGFSGTIEEFLEMLRELFKSRTAPTAGPKGSYRYRR